MKRLLRSIVLATILWTLLASPAVAAPLVFPYVDQDGFPMDSNPPSVTASSWILYDESSDTVLAESDADTRRPMASITKIMTVLLALENGNVSDEVVVSETAAGQGGQEMGLVAGETVTLGALVRAAMVRSGNDAAAAIAEHIGGSVDGFVDMMNERAIELDMVNTHFMNPNGLDTSGHYSSARDMLTVSRVAMALPEFENLVRSRIMVFPDTPNGTPRGATNTNRILDTYEGAIGVKTGETPNAGLTYVGAVERDGRRVFAVLLRSVGRRAHFSDAIQLFDWAFDDLRIQGTLAAGIPYQPVAARTAESPLVAEARLETFLHTTGQGLTAEITDLGQGSSSTAQAAEVDIVRNPDPAPDSVLSTFTYWLGLVTGAFGG
ncbi:MAG: D-alanyl-D-alanine carboxypeptidase family protein [Acidimicrobiia bacterium]